MRRLLSVIACFALLGSTAFAGELNIVSYNILNYPGSTGAVRNPHFQTVIQSLAPDIIAAQEVTNTTGANGFLNDVLDVIDPGGWSMGFFHNGNDSDRALYYRTGVVNVIDAGFVTTALRSIDWWEIEDIASGEVFRIYTCHLKASTGTTNENKRLAEVTLLRNDLDSLDSTMPFILMGDFNIYKSSEPAYQLMLSAGAGQLADPINQPGTWHDNAGFAPIHTQSTRTTSFGGGATGGMDDRFDQILTSEEFSDGTGIEELPGTYLAYGQDGAHFNTNIVNGANGVVSDSIATALHQASDHLPVFMTLFTPEATTIAGAVPEMRLQLSVAPNPFNPRTTVRFTLPEAGVVSLIVYNVSGREVTTLSRGWQPAGELSHVWEGTDLSGRPVESGVYFLRLLAGAESKVHKVVLVK